VLGKEEINTGFVQEWQQKMGAKYYLLVEGKGVIN
jgi:hypothetical protein